jgi:hypothetical protein
MKNIKKDLIKIYGYLLKDSEVLNLYFQGELLLTDKEENELINYFNL